jgi:phage baseplate assembly protein gpV
MIEFGTVKEVDATKATAVVTFEHLQTEATCSIVVPTTGSNAVYYLPSVGTQVVCWLEGGKNIALGCVFSEADPVPDTVDENTHIQQFGKAKIILKADSMRLEMDSISILMDDKITFNDGSKGSYLTDINSLVSQLQRLENAMNSLKQALTVWVPVTMDGGAALKAAITSWAAQLIQPLTSVNDLKDDKVKH